MQVPVMAPFCRRRPSEHVGCFRLLIQRATSRYNPYLKAVEIRIGPFMPVWLSPNQAEGAALEAENLEGAIPSSGTIYGIIE